MTVDLPGGLVAAEIGRPLGGGDIGQVRRARLEDGREVVVKTTPYDADLEVEGLLALQEAGAEVPPVLAHDAGTIVLGFVSSSAPDWAGVGRRLARVHRAEATRFGWSRDNRIGTLVQPNEPTDDWPTFFAERRLEPHLGASVLPSETARRVRRAIEGPLPELLEHDVRPSLVHGDLWPGNVLDGRWLIDPAVHHADREYDLAVAALFGGLPEAVERAYDEVFPLDDGWRRRRPALQLPHLLVHVRLFGAGYVSGVRARLDTLGW